MIINAFYVLVIIKDGKRLLLFLRYVFARIRMSSDLTIETGSTFEQGKSITLDHCDAILFESEGQNWKELFAKDEKWSILSIIHGM